MATERTVPREDPNETGPRAGVADERRGCGRHRGCRDHVRRAVWPGRVEAPSRATGARGFSPHGGRSLGGAATVCGSPPTGGASVRPAGAPNPRAERADGRAVVPAPAATDLGAEGFDGGAAVAGRPAG